MQTLQTEKTPTITIIKRTGKLVTYDAGKIRTAIGKAFAAVHNEEEVANSSSLVPQIEKLTQDINEVVIRTANKSFGSIHIEEIQDIVEKTLMRESRHEVAKSYVLYRENRRQEREKAEADSVAINVKTAEGNLQPVTKEYLAKFITPACTGLSAVNPDLIIEDTLRNLFDGVPEIELHKATIMSTRSLIETEPEYSSVAARLLLNLLKGEALKFLGEQNKTASLKKLYPTLLTQYIKKGISLELLNEKMQEFDLVRLGNAINADGDYKFAYLGLQTLYDRYFIHHDNVRFELPQIFFMRIAMGLALKEDDKNARAIEFYKLLSSFDFMNSTPTLFNSGTKHSQLSSCYLTTVDDDLASIFNSIRDNALLSKYAGGLGNDWTPVRGLNSHIKGTNGKSQGVVPFLKVANDTAVAVNQGGKRKGAVCAYLETWHIDVEEFLELRKNTGDDRRRTHDMNTANWVPDLFMQRVHENAVWTLFSPNEVPELHDLYGKAFNAKYQEYEAKALRGEIFSKQIPANILWRKMIGMLFETGHPWITFKDPCNLRSPQQHTGVVHSSNLCTEITLNTNREEIAVCNLGSINLPAHITNGKLDKEKLQKTINTAIRMLDNVIDINYYPVPQARNSNIKHRPIGIGIMGFQDTLHKLDMKYASKEAISFADQSMEQISYFAINASCNLAKERGKYESYEGSLWSQGVLPIDSIVRIEENRDSKYCSLNTDKTLDWDSLRNLVKQNGIRNSNIMAIAPTATIANICGVSASIEPTYQNLFVKSNLSGEFTVVNTYLVADLKKLNIWDSVMVNDLKYFDGRLQKIERIPAKLKEKYQTAFEIDPAWIIQCAARRQKWIDQSQSLNLYIAQASGKALDLMYKLAWKLGLKTTYYLRSLGASDPEKSTIDRSDHNAVKVCSIEDPDCEACQ